jgi:hypothetical protein
MRNAPSATSPASSAIKRYRRHPETGGKPWCQKWNARGFRTLEASVIGSIGAGLSQNDCSDSLSPVSVVPQPDGDLLPPQPSISLPIGVGFQFGNQAAHSRECAVAWPALPFLPALAALHELAGSPRISESGQIKCSSPQNLCIDPCARSGPFKKYLVRRIPWFGPPKRFSLSKIIGCANLR